MNRAECITCQKGPYYPQAARDAKGHNPYFDCKVGCPIDPAAILHRKRRQQALRDKSNKRPSAYDKLTKVTLWKGASS